MFDQYVREAIELEVKDIFKNYNINEMIDLYIKSLVIITPVETGIKINLIESIEGFYNQDGNIRKYHTCIINIEPYLKKLLFLVMPNKYNEISRNSKLGLYHTMQTIGLLKKLPDNINLVYAKPEKYYGTVEEYIIHSYQIRNDISHSSTNWSFSEMTYSVKAIIITSLYAAWINRDMIDQANMQYLDSKIYGFDEYIYNILNGYNEEMKKGFKYVPLLWEKTNDIDVSTETNIKIDDLLDYKKNKENHLMLVGEAGCGKTTSVDYLEYCDAKRYKNGESNFIPLKITLINEDNIYASVEDMICRKLNIPFEYCQKLLIDNRIHLYLDGINEVLIDIDAKKTLAINIEKFLKKYNKLFVVITDRTFTVIKINISTIYHLKKMTIDDIRRYAETKVNDPEIIGKVILTVMKSEFANMRFTPIFINNLLTMFAQKEDVPEDNSEFIDKYINSLFKREYNEKKDYNAAPGRLDLLLTIFSTIEFSQVGVHYTKVLRSFGEIADTYGLNINTESCINLAIQIGILKRQGDFIDFALDEYKTYFLLKAIEYDV
jgi:energy-coupling factor transporter ATP-binding protein EcfA2